MNVLKNMLKLCKNVAKVLNLKILEVLKICKRCDEKYAQF